MSNECYTVGKYLLHNIIIKLLHVREYYDSFNIIGVPTYITYIKDIFRVYRIYESIHRCAVSDNIVMYYLIYIGCNV